MEEIIEELQSDKLIQKYLYKYTWLSGSNTNVSPITIWRNKDESIREIVIQLDNDKNVYNKLIERYKAKYKCIDYAYFDRSDGSCPSSLVFKMKGWRD